MAWEEGLKFRPQYADVVPRVGFLRRSGCGCPERRALLEREIEEQNQEKTVHGLSRPGIADRDVG